MSHYQAKLEPAVSLNSRGRERVMEVRAIAACWSPSLCACLRPTPEWPWCDHSYFFSGQKVPCTPVEYVSSSGVLEAQDVPALHTAFCHPTDFSPLLPSFCWPPHHPSIPPHPTVPHPWQSGPGCPLVGSPHAQDIRAPQGSPLSPSIHQVSLPDSFPLKRSSGGSYLRGYFFLEHHWYCWYGMDPTHMVVFAVLARWLDVPCCPCSQENANTDFC